jgi:hypothetical protein
MQYAFCLLKELEGNKSKGNEACGGLGKEADCNFKYNG